MPRFFSAGRPSRFASDSRLPLLPLGEQIAIVHPIRILSASAQVAAHIRRDIERGRWTDNLPGVGPLSAELAVNHKTVESALRQLEHEGHILSQGARRCRRIVAVSGNPARPLRIAILYYEATDRFISYIVELQHALADAGHTTVAAAKCLTELARACKSGGLALI